MRNFVLAALAVLALSASAGAQVTPSLVVHIPDVFLNQSSSPQNGSFDVWVEEVGGDVGVASYNLGIHQSPSGLVTFTGAGVSVDHTSLFNNGVVGQVPVDRTVNNPATFTAGRDIYLTDDFTSGGNPVDAPVDNANRNGLFSVKFTVGADVAGSRLLLPELSPNFLGFFTATGANVPFTFAPGGSITITPVPEPATLGLALLGLPLLARRRR